MVSDIFIKLYHFAGTIVLYCGPLGSLMRNIKHISICTYFLYVWEVLHIQRGENAIRKYVYMRYLPTELTFINIWVWAAWLVNRNTCSRVCHCVDVLHWFEYSMGNPVQFIHDSSVTARALSQDKDHLSPDMGILMLKIRRPRDHLIFNIGIPILVRRHLHIETAPRCPIY